MKPPTERQLIKWWDARIAAYRAEQGVESPILTCADCGRVASYRYVQPQHPHWTDGREDIALCASCLNAIIERKRAERRAELAGRPRDCQRCMARPHTFTWGPYRLCGRCLTASKREHAKAQANGGMLAIFVTGPLVDTRAWAGRQPLLTPTEERMP